MANVVRIATQVTGVGKASSDVDNLRDKFAKLQKQGAKGMVTGIAVGAGIGAFNLLASSAGRVTDVLVDTVKAGIAEEAQIARLSAALSANAKGWDGNMEAIERRIDGNKRLAFSDDEQRDALTKLIPVTQNVNDAFNAQAVAMDLARFKNISLEEAAGLLAKAFNGQTRGLKELGIPVKEITTKLGILAAVEEKTAGQAQAFADSHAGAVKRIGDAWDDFSEDAGKNALSAFDDLATGIAYFDWRAREAQKAGDGLAFITDLVGDNATEAGRGMTDYAVAMNMAAAANRSSARELAAFTSYLTPADKAIVKATDATDDLKSSLDSLRESWDILNGRIKANDEFANLPDKIIVARDEAQTALAELNAAISGGNEVAIAGARIRLRDARAELAALEREFSRLRVAMEKPVVVGRVIRYGGGSRNIDRLPGSAAGGPASGVTLVGEKGPEIVDLPAGSYVHSNAESTRMAARLPAAGGGGTTFYVTANLSPTGYSPAQAEQIANAVGPAIATYLRRRGLLVN